MTTTERGREGPGEAVGRLASGPWGPGEWASGLLGDEEGGEINLREYGRLVWAGRYIVLAAAAVALVAAMAWAFTRTPVYQTTATISIDTRPPQIIRNQINFGPNIWEMERYMKEQVRILQSTTVAQAVVDRLGLDRKGGEAVGAPLLLHMIDVEPVKESNIINLSMEGENPQQITEWLNLYIDEYINFNIEDNLKRTRQIFDVIQSKLEPLRKQLTTSEQRLTQFKERQDSLLFADQDKNVITEQVNTLTTEYAKAKADRIQLETKINALEQLRREKVPMTSFPEILNDPTIQALRQQRNQLEVELQEKLKTYRDSHPIIKDLRGRIEGIDGQIHEQVTALISALRTEYEIKQRREKTLYASIQQLKDQSIELSKQTMEYEKLRREYEQNKSFYEDMLARSKEADISGTVSLNNVRIIDPARQPTHPVAPNVPRTLGMALALGLFLGVGVVFLLDYLDQTVRTPEEVERVLGQDVFAVVPVIREERETALREVFQALRTAVMIAARDDRPQVLMVTSAGPGEGKTTTCLRLAEVLAAGGSRVLLIDADLRKPAMHRHVDSKNVRGLTSVVLGERTLDEVLVDSPRSPGLDVMTSGPLPPNPPELFGKSSFSRLLDDARERYDWVLIDTPPVMSVTDAVVCSRLADMVLQVVAYGTLERRALQGALRHLVRAEARVVGVVLNRVDVDRDRYYNDSYYYTYYHYGEGEASAAAGREESGAP